MQNKARVVVLISGRGSNLLALLTATETKSLPYTIVGVVSDNTQAAGLHFAIARKIPTTVIPRSARKQSAEQFNQKLIDATERYEPDFVALAGFMRIVSSNFVALFRNKLINIHPSLLPDFKGLHVHERVIASGEDKSGCTVHFVTEEMDGGAILAQAVVPVIAGDTPETLAARILEREHVLYPAVLASLASGAICFQEQNGQSIPLLLDNPFFPTEDCYRKGTAVGMSHYNRRYD